MGWRCADTQTDSRCAAGGCVAAQVPPTSNTGGLNWRKNWIRGDWGILTKLYIMNNAE